MNDPERLLDRHDSELAGALLRALKADAPRADSKRRALAAAAFAAATAKSSAGSAAGSLLGSAAKWAMVGGLLGGTLAGGGALLERRAAPPPLASVVSPAGARMNELAQSERVPPPSQRETPRAQELPAPPRPAASSAEPGTDLREQRLAIEAARQELSAGRADAALAKLDDYRVRFPRLAFHQESIVLRIEALQMRGDHASARSLGRTFLDANPDSPLARRVRSLTRLP
jgi:hypothetical protein